MKHKVLFLYTEIAEYFLSGIEILRKKNADIYIVKWATNKEAPFKFRNIEGVRFYEREVFSNKKLLSLAKEINPDIIIVSGWVDKAYLKIAKHFKNKKRTVLTLDNHWEKSLKQNIARVISPFILKNKFSYVWVPGAPQKEYALKLGFKKNNILTGFYSADTHLFSEFGNKYQFQKDKNYPKKILFVGRYINEKGIFLLWEAFAELQKENPNEWELVCVGTGKLFKQRIKHPKIKHIGFVQPNKMGEIISETGVFVLPSNFEPWGVVVHEYAAAGYPIICSDKVGAATMFLEEGKNGFSFKSGNKESLKKALKKTMNLSVEKLIEMGEMSREKSQRLSPQNWAETVMKILER